jgi:hypothetical protein
MVKEATTEKTAQATLASTTSNNRSIVRRIMPRQDFAAIAPLSKLPPDPSCQSKQCRGPAVVPVKYGLSAGLALQSVGHKYCLRVYIP